MTINLAQATSWGRPGKSGSVNVAVLHSLKCRKIGSIIPKPDVNQGTGAMRSNLAAGSI
jgi:hypothetical protein